MADRVRRLQRLRSKAATGDLCNSVRRHAEMLVDQTWVLGTGAWRRYRPPRRSTLEPFDGQPRFALLVVNFSTTKFLKLMLLTLTEQSALGLVGRIIVVDNASRDGGQSFLRGLASAAPRVSVVDRRHFLSHAHGMRAAVAALDHVEAGLSPEAQSNVLLFCDADVVFRDADALGVLADAFAVHGAALAGELRHLHEYPDIQASFVAVRRDVYHRADVLPPVHHGSPAYWMQRSIWRAGDLPVVDFPSNHGGHILHRGRTGVTAAHAYRPHHSYSTVPSRSPHFMGVPDGARIWERIEARYEKLLEADAELRLIHVLASRLEEAATTSAAETAHEAHQPAHHRPAEDAADVAPLNPAAPLMWSPGVLQRQSLSALVVSSPTGKPMRLAGTGPVIWSLFEEPTSPDQAVNALAERFATLESTIRAELMPFLHELVSVGALRAVRDGDDLPLAP